MQKIILLVIVVCLIGCHPEQEQLRTSDEAIEHISPYDHIDADESIHIYKEGIWIDGSFSLCRYDNTHSMDPVLDYGMTGIRKKVEKKDDIHIGDIVTYKSGDSLIAHRVIEIDTDEQGWYAVTKGDNLNSEDPSKKRIEDIKYVLVGVIY